VPVFQQSDRLGHFASSQTVYNFFWRKFSLMSKTMFPLASADFSQWGLLTGLFVRGCSSGATASEEIFS
jgi:hypothetical protein